jgi:O-antigen/teichoic acid export membrane protein
MLAVIAKIGTPEMVGRFALAFAVTAPIFMFGALNLRAVQATDARRSYGFGDYLTLRLIALAAAMLATALLISLVPFERETAVVISLVAAAKAVESASDVYYGFLQRHERMDWISKSLMLKGVASVIALAAGLYVGRTIAWGVLGLTVAWACVLSFYDLPHAARAAQEASEGSPRPRWDPRSLRSLAWLALPLGAATLVYSLEVNIPRLFIERMHGPRELGFFAAMAYVPIAGARVVTALGESASPRLARYFAERRPREYIVLVKRTMWVGFALGIAGFLVALFLGKPLLSFVYRPEYAKQSHVFVLLLAAAAIWYVALFLQYAMMAARRFRAQPLILGVSLVALVVSCIALVGPYGNSGAAIAMIIGAAVQMIGNAGVTWRAITSL